ncbi:MAG TPA: FUSC family protein [Xanthobacteraceae bacterium]|jgi:uncharacterized membrane protein YccC|nr:FUSC family protein [Xanthobacteraceae bacterium]
MINGVGFRPVIFSVNCYLATVLALFIAFSLDLKNPGWAMTTVYLTSQPLSGALRAKAFYRIIGTFVGAAAMIAIIPNLIDAPELTTVAIILWVALCVFISLLDRTPRAYMFVLSGYTAALIGFPSVLAPDTVFDTAVARVEEITLGVACAAIVHSLLFPKSVLSAFEARLQGAIDGARHWISEAMIKPTDPSVITKRRQIAADISELYVLATSLRFDTAAVRPDIRIIRAFDRKIVAVLPLVCAIEDRLRVLRSIGPLDAKLTQVLICIHDWVETNTPDERHRAAELKDACTAAIPNVGPQSSWGDLVTVNVLVRLRELVDSWQACLDLADYLADPSQAPSADIRTAAAQVGSKQLHTDSGIALLSAFAAACAMGLCAFFWVTTSWPEGANAIAIAAVACTLFASLDDPSPTIRSITVILALSIPIVIIYQFFILPAISGYELLAIVIAFTLLPAGFLMGIPAYAPLGLALALGFTVELSVQTSYTADLAVIINSDSAFVVGALAALIVTQLIRVIGTQASARRLIRATYYDLADLADGSAQPTREQWASRILDRVGLLFYRRSPSTPQPQHEFADALEDLRLGVNIIETHAVTPILPHSVQQTLSAMFAGIAPFFRSLAHGGGAPLGESFLHQIDAAIDQMTACNAATHASVAAIVGLRRTLYPDAPPYLLTRMVAAAPQTGPSAVIDTRGAS